MRDRVLLDLFMRQDCLSRLNKKRTKWIESRGSVCVISPEKYQENTVCSLFRSKRLYLIAFFLSLVVSFRGGEARKLIKTTKRPRGDETKRERESMKLHKGCELVVLLLLSN